MRRPQYKNDTWTAKAVVFRPSVLAVGRRRKQKHYLGLSWTCAVVNRLTAKCSDEKGMWQCVCVCVARAFSVHCILLKALCETLRSWFAFCAAFELHLLPWDGMKIKVCSFRWLHLPISNAEAEQKVKAQSMQTNMEDSFRYSAW